eukprot:1175483-Prorocentrum_minimum.AAC.1
MFNEGKSRIVNETTQEGLGALKTLFGKIAIDLATQDDDQGFGSLSNVNAYIQNSFKLPYVKNAPPPPPAKQRGVGLTRLRISDHHQED